MLSEEIQEILTKCDNCKLTECIGCDITYTEKNEIREYINQLEAENTNLKKIKELGLNKEKQYCFNEDGHTGKCLGYGDDEPCNYCKSCERLSIKEDD